LNTKETGKKNGQLKKEKAQEDREAQEEKAAQGFAS